MILYETKPKTKQKPQNPKQKKKGKNKKKNKLFFLWGKIETNPIHCLFNFFRLSNNQSTMPRGTTSSRWIQHLISGESVLLTVHASGKPDASELNGPQHTVVFTNGAFEGFRDSQTETLYSSPSGLCRAKLQRNGPLNTNQWQGPRHVLVSRNGNWVAIADLV